MGERNEWFAASAAKKEKEEEKRRKNVCIYRNNSGPFDPDPRTCVSSQRRGVFQEKLPMRPERMRGHNFVFLTDRTSGSLASRAGQGTTVLSSVSVASSRGAGPLTVGVMSGSRFRVVCS